MSAGYDGGHKRQKEVILMAGFHDIIGHDDIIRDLKNAGTSICWGINTW